MKNSYGDQTGSRLTGKIIYSTRARAHRACARKDANIAVDKSFESKGHAYVLAVTSRGETDPKPITTHLAVATQARSGMISL